MLKRPYSQDSIKLATPCRACGYTKGLIIIRYEGDMGFVRCGWCDSALFAVTEQPLVEVAA
jgi:hypothetical protein